MRRCTSMPVPEIKARGISLNEYRRIASMPATSGFKTGSDPLRACFCRRHGKLSEGSDPVLKSRNPRTTDSGNYCGETVKMVDHVRKPNCNPQHARVAFGTVGCLQYTGFSQADGYRARCCAAGAIVSPGAILEFSSHFASRDQHLKDGLNDRSQ